MVVQSVEGFVEFLKASITPVAMISGVGLILLSLTNRLGRTIDRSRLLIKELSDENVQKKETKCLELKILYRRSRILRSSIASISFSILTSSLIIPILLLMNYYQFKLQFFGIMMFILSILAIIISSVLLLIDVILTLNALKHEVKEYI